jgi:hypothetical protein
MIIVNQECGSDHGLFKIYIDSTVPTLAVGTEDIPELELG